MMLPAAPVPQNATNHMLRACCTYCTCILHLACLIICFGDHQPENSSSGCAGNGHAFPSCILAPMACRAFRECIEIWPTPLTPRQLEPSETYQ